MPRSKTRKGASVGKSTRAPKSVDEYLTKVPEPARTVLNKMRAAIRSALPVEATETISYSMPAFKHKKVLVWFAAFSNHCSLFPTASIIEEFKSELEDFSTTKGTIHFPIDKPLPVALIKRMVKARAAQVAGKTPR
ncbi:MAG TPA: DUF1801 domain-containing protein [Terriglobales bacterium]|nr:DUF1801 domain-containing protein [Terriglobales bacterium]